MNKYLCLLVMLIPAYLFSQVVAKVEQYQITTEQIQNKIQNYDNKFSYQEAKRLALTDLINERALLIYAKQNSITVTNQEVENFFISQFGNHASLQTAGIFDYDKFVTLKNSERGKRIWSELEQDLLLDKTKTLIKNSLEIDDDKLLEKFIYDNVKIDINYAILEIDQIAIDTNITPDKAYDFYQQHKTDILFEADVNLEFAVILKEALQPEATQLYNKRKDVIAANNQSNEEKNKADYATILDSLWLKTAALKKSLWEKNKADFQIFQTGLIENTKVFHPLINSKELFQSASKLKDGEIGMYQTHSFILLFKINYSKNLTDLDPRKLWNSYLEFSRLDNSTERKQQFYYENIEDFIVPAAIVLKIALPGKLSGNKKEEILTELKNYVYDDEALTRISLKYKLHSQNEIIYLAKYKNSELNQSIAEKIKQSNYWGYLETNKNVVFYRYSSLFPEYIPTFDTAKDYISIPLKHSLQDTTGFYHYYISNPNQFFTPDSLQLGGVFVPIIADTVTITQNQIKTYYETNKTAFILEKSVQFEFLFHHDKALITTLYTQINQRNFLEMKTLFNQPLELPTHDFVEYNSLPESIRSALLNCFNDRILSPLPYADGWLILWKKQEHQSGLVSFAQVEASIRKNLQFNIANQEAFKLARQVFESTRYFSSCYQNAPADLIFKTKLRNIDDTFEFLGRLNNKEEFLRLWNNEKYSSIMQFENGYAVVFLLQRKASEKMNYSNSIAKISQILHENTKIKKAMKYAQYLRSELLNRSNPEKLFYFFGGWKSAEGLTLQSSIPGILYSNLILQDIIKHETGYYSPVLQISENQLFLYSIADIRRVPRQTFYSNKEQYKSRIMQERYEDWLQKFKSTLSIIVY